MKGRCLQQEHWGTEWRQEVMFIASELHGCGSRYVTVLQVLLPFWSYFRGLHTPLSLFSDKGDRLTLL